ncbi:MAG TPA: alpha/beta fold hydrolase [Candidatus Eremiobacteraceae bacterium]|nr:alpha/beta fold hydrolase [Candidatus Eremiobacteraceae bacterium]
MHNKKELLQAGGGILCLVAGAYLALHSMRGYAERRYVVDPAACQMNLLMLSPSNLPAEAERGSVVLLHGLSANNIIMQHLARAFVNLGLRVYIPDLPGHGHSPGPFTPERAESCTASLLRGLAARGMIVPDRTVLVGHSMGGAIALSVAEKFRPAGVIALSPAPMIASHGATSEDLLFHRLPLPTANTLILVGQLEPEVIVANAADLAAHSPDLVKFVKVPWNTHVGVLFSGAVARESQEWAAHALRIPDNAQLPTRANVFAGVLGIIGVLLIGGPFLREMVGKKPAVDIAEADSVPRWRGIVETLLFSVVAIYVLHYWQPSRILHLFEGDYLAGFFLFVGFGLILLHLGLARKVFRCPPGLVISGAVAAILLLLLLTGWFELTAMASWLNLQRWLRLPLFAIAAFPFFYALELLAGPVMNGVKRYAYWFFLPVLAWLALSYGVLYQRSGEILPVLLAPYFALVFLLVGAGIQLVRRVSGSATVAAVFGAILLAGFCLVLFPLT